MRRDLLSSCRNTQCAKIKSLYPQLPVSISLLCPSSPQGGTCFQVTESYSTRAVSGGICNAVEMVFPYALNGPLHLLPLFYTYSGRHALCRAAHDHQFMPQKGPLLGERSDNVIRTTLPWEPLPSPYRRWVDIFIAQGFEMPMITRPKPLPLRTGCQSGTTSLTVDLNGLPQSWRTCP
jgi:hypothetical protein